MTEIWIAVLILTAAAAFFAGRYWQRTCCRRQIRHLNLKLEAMMRGEFESDFAAYQEGELSILAGQLELTAKRMENMLAQLSQEKERAKDFIADVSHQLKTPLTALLTYLELQQDVEKNPEQKKRLDKCVLLAQRMNDLIRSLLDFARLEAGSVTMRLEEHDLTETVRRAVCAAQAAHTRSISVKLDAPGCQMARYDEKWLSQAVFNLVKNAMDYAGEPPRVSVCVHTEESGVQVTVVDNGMGIGEEDLPHLFDRFYRTKHSLQGGAGIGLPLAQEIVRRHHGFIRASNEEAGTTFRLLLPRLNCVRKTDT